MLQEGGVDAHALGREPPRNRGEAMKPNIDSAGGCGLLFVYGTLRRGFRLHQQLVRLGATFQGEGKVAAELFGLGGSYPGARAAERAGRWVQGELYQLREPARDLRVLDAIEDFNPGTPEHSEFVRALTEVLMQDGPAHHAWIYWLGPNVKAIGCRIDSGDYATGGRRQVNPTDKV